MIRNILLVLFPCLTIADELLSTELWNGCNNLDDGEHWVRFLDDTSDYGNVLVHCSNGFAILDASLQDTTNFYKSDLSAYFSSFAYWTDSIVSSSLDDHVSWTEWFLPYSNGDSFRVSADCSTCTTTETYGELSTYYMTGNYIGCLWITKGYCDMDPDTLECYTCSIKENATVYTGLCTHVETNGDYPVYSEHEDCVGDSYNLEPSIGANGQFCVCYKPAESKKIAAAEWTIDESLKETNKDTDESVNIELRQSDFTNGPYRILVPGTYTIMEDIEFDMNVGDYNDPNAEGAWYPTEEQGDDYEGAGVFVGAYSMGFFAGITIETSDVVLDLNGKKLSMSKVFHFQQRWFSIIELGSKAFLSGQGPGNFGPFMNYAVNVVIKNGELGLSSHHGIHGNGGVNIVIQDLRIYDFEVAGIAMNGFKDLTIKNVEIGPIYTSVPVLGVYTQARIMLSRLQYITEENPESTITFDNREGEYTAEDVLKELKAEMDIMFKHYINNVDYDTLLTEYTAEQIAAARTLFENNAQIPSASTVYGIFLNSEGASVFSIGGAPGTSTGATLENVYIHGLYNDPWEVPRIVLTKGPFNDIMDITRITDNAMVDSSSATYIGSSYSDAQYTLHLLTDSWSALGHSVLDDVVVNWIQGVSKKKLKTLGMKCNNDIMLHVTKGIFGLRVDSVLNVNFNNIKIEDLQNVGVLGSNVCGEYTSESDGGHRNQNYPLQYGYTGTEIHAMSFVRSAGTIDNIEITNVVSARGDAFGLQFFPGNEITIGTVKISDIHAGVYLDEDELDASNSMPNKKPRACAIDYWYWSDPDDLDDYSPNSLTYDASTLSLSCVSSHVACNYLEWDKELSDTVSTCDSSNLISDLSLIKSKKAYKHMASKSEKHARLYQYVSTSQYDRNTKKIPYHNQKPKSLIPVNDHQTTWYYNSIIYIFGIAIVVIGLLYKKFGDKKKRPTLINEPASDLQQIFTQKVDYGSI